MEIEKTDPKDSILKDFQRTWEKYDDMAQEICQAAEQLQTMRTIRGDNPLGLSTCELIDAIRRAKRRIIKDVRDLRGGALYIVTGTTHYKDPFLSSSENWRPRMLDPRILVPRGRVKRQWCDVLKFSALVVNIDEFYDTGMSRSKLYVEDKNLIPGKDPRYDHRVFRFSNETHGFLKALQDLTINPNPNNKEWLWALSVYQSISGIPSSLSPENPLIRMMCSPSHKLSLSDMMKHISGGQYGIPTHYRIKYSN